MTRRREIKKGKVEKGNKMGQRTPTERNKQRRT
jgi:hypothetical protein